MTKIPTIRVLTSLLIPGALAFVLTNQAAVQAQDLTDLATVAESSGFTATSTSSEVEAFVDACCEAPHVTRVDFGTTMEGRPMLLAVIGQDAADSLETRDDRLRILLLGNIHSGECAGKEALLSLLRELASQPDHPWLKHAVIAIAPNYNADANDRIGPDHRPGQVGPDAGMGQRENAQQLDLNRDFVKLESPEARALVGLFRTFDPHMFIDCHTTNGSEHQYKLTYDIPHNPSAPESIRSYLRNRMMPRVTQALKEKGILTWYYGNFDRQMTQWATYGHEPRYSTEYAGLRGCLGILSEAYAYATYQERIEASDQFVRECVNHVLFEPDEVRRLLDSTREEDVATARENPDSILIHLQSELVAFEDKIRVAGYRDGEPHEYEVEFFGDYRPTTSVSLPRAYLLPPEMSLQAERLQMHGIQVEQLTRAATLPVSVYTTRVIQRAPFRFQGHEMVSVEASKRSDTMAFAKGTWVVRTTQPLARLAAYMLEPETNEGLVTWNLLDRWLEVDSDYPIVRVEQPVEFESEPVTEITPSGRLRLTDIFGADAANKDRLGLDDISWVGNGKAYTLPKNGRMLVVDVETGAESRPVSATQPEALQQAIEKLDGVSSRDVRGIINGIEPRSGPEQTLQLITIDQRTLLWNDRNETLIAIGNAESPAELAELNPAGNRCAWVSGHNLWTISDQDTQPRQLTHDGDEKLLNGKLDWVYQEELYGRGNFKAFWWSPDGETLAWLKTDESPVHIYTVVDHLPVRGSVEATAYPKAGDPLPKVTLHLASASDGSGGQVDLPQRDEVENGELLLSRVTWDPTDNTLLVQVQNRIQTWLDLIRIDRDSFQGRLLFRDATPAWIESPGDPEFLGDGRFLWLSPASGQRALKVYDRSGELVRTLTPPRFGVRELLGVTDDGNTVYFIGCPDNPTRTSLMKASIDGGEATKVVDFPGSQTVKFNAAMTHFLCESSTLNSPGSVQLHRADGSYLRTVVPDDTDWLRHHAAAFSEFVRVPVGSDDDTGHIDGLIYRPGDWDGTTALPVVVHVYGGPQAPRVRDRFAGQIGLWHQYLAQQGYLVFVVDPRPSSYAEIRETWKIHLNLADRELDDLLDAVAWLKDNYSVDDQRIGLWGWSYGGYMTAYAMTHSDVFTAGIAGAPVTDWRNYDAIYTERYMSTPQLNPDGYTRSSVLESARNLQGRLLLIHGSIDDNVHMANTMQFAHALQKAGKPFEMMVYPGNRHSVRDPEQQLHLHQMMTEFLDRNVKAKARDAEPEQNP